MSKTDELKTLRDQVERLTSLVERLTRGREPTVLESIFPGRWRKEWSGRGKDWDAHGSEEFVAVENRIDIGETTAVATSWNVDVIESGDKIRLRQHHDVTGCTGLADIEIAISGSPAVGYSGFELVHGHRVAVKYSPISEPVAS
jgi:hypothetical protein